MFLEQHTQIVDAATLSGGLPNGNTDYAYDVNGNTIKEGSNSIAYNLLNLPRRINLIGVRSIANTYAADGRKLFTEVREGTATENGTKYYNGNLVFDKNKELEYILFDEGRIIHDDDNFTFEYHLRDHLGSVRVAFEPTTSGKKIVQENAFYVSGSPINDLSFNLSDNRYKRESKEYIDDFDWNKYDFIGRTFDTWTLRSLQIDPMAEKYNSMSPYSLWGNSFVNAIDPTGRDWYINLQTEELLFNRKQRSDNFQNYDAEGNVTASYARIGGNDHFGKDHELYDVDFAHMNADAAKDFVSRYGNESSLSPMTREQEKRNDYRMMSKNATDFSDKVGYALAAWLGDDFDDRFSKAAEKPVQKIANMNPLMLIGHAAAGIESGWKKDAFGNDMDAISWGAMGFGAPFSIFGKSIASILISLGSDIGNDLRTRFNKKKEKKP